MAHKTYPAVLFVLVSTVYMMVFVQGIVMTVPANDIMRDMSLTAGHMGLLGSSYLYAYAAVMLFSGLIAASLGPRKTLGFAFLLSSAGGVVFAHSHSFIPALIGRAFTGMGLATTMTSAFTIFARWYAPRSFPRLSAFFFTIGGLGAFLATAVLPLMDDAWGWRNMFLFLAGVSFASSVLCFLIIRDWPPSSRMAALRKDSGNADLSVRSLCLNFRQVALSFDFWRLVVWFAATVGGYYAFTGLWVMPYLKDVYGFSHAQAGAMTSMIALGFIAFTPLIVWLCDHVAKSYRFGLGAAGVLTAAVFAVLIRRIDSLPVPALYAMMFVIGVVLNGPGALGYAAGRNLFGPRMAGVTSGVFGCSVFLGGAILQVICGYLLDYAENKGWSTPDAYALAFGIFLLCGIASAVAGFTVSPKSYPEQERSE